jgi:2-polyprenyl-6-methoxyphenol hydroxylase-like FAD-dependent oxidoreductase
LDIPDPNDPKDWTFQIASSRLGSHDHTLTNEERRALLKERVKDLAEPYRSANLWIPDETIVHHDPMTYWIPMPWDNHEGRVTLAGDAVHPLPPCKLPFLSLLTTGF